MIVVADSSPLNYLVLIGEIDVLGEMFGKVLVPHAVLQELKAPNASTSVRAWIDNPPSWIEIHPSPAINIPLLADLDSGEREAIQLALTLKIDMILIDELDGRKQAELLSLKVRGTLRVIEEAAAIGKTNFQEALAKLQQTNFRMSPALLKRFLDRDP